MNPNEIRDVLADEAERMESDKTSRRHIRASSRVQEPSQVYSIRIPVERLEQLRLIAAKNGERPTALLRRWALERLRDELSTPATDSTTPVSETSLSLRMVEFSLDSARIGGLGRRIRLATARNVEKVSA
jgi:hypothetical protein